jgi:uncharacterized protein YukE
MAVLHMDVDACQGMQRDIIATQTQLSEQVTSLTNLIDNMIGKSWIAQGATQYQGDYQKWIEITKKHVDELKAFGDRLQEEIKRWEEFAKTY